MTHNSSIFSRRLFSFFALSFSFTNKSVRGFSSALFFFSSVFFFIFLMFLTTFCFPLPSGVPAAASAKGCMLRFCCCCFYYYYFHYSYYYYSCRHRLRCRCCLCSSSDCPWLGCCFSTRCCLCYRCRCLSCRRSLLSQCSPMSGRI